MWLYKTDGSKFFDKVNTQQAREEQLIEQIAEHYKAILQLIGEDPQREGLLKTPRRAAKALYDMTVGYRQDPIQVARKAIFDHDGSGMIIVRDIEFYSMCEHHILPFFGHISIGYLPKGRMLGLSKLARVVDVFARRIQVQERITIEICRLIDEAVPNDGVIVVCNAQHMCMKMRGVEKQDSTTTTIECCGRFIEDAALRAEFLKLVEDKK